MLKTVIKVSLLGLVASILLTGCGARKTLVTQLNPTMNKTTMAKCSSLKDMSEKSCRIDNDDNKLFLILGESNRSEYGFVHARYNNSTYAVLQASAAATLGKNKKYFSIISPATLSNSSGGLINTVEEFGKKCTINAAQVLIRQLDPCGLHPRSGKGTGALMVISMSNTQSNDYISWDAKKVIEDLKAAKEYDPTVETKNFLLMEYNGQDIKQTKSMDFYIKEWK